MDPHAYPGDVGKVKLIETHISFLFFTGEHVYKVKKPVEFGFLDFTSLAKRKKFCHEEVSLNFSLAPTVYLGVVPVTLVDGQYAVDGPGTPVEYAVKMRQLPGDGSLDSLINTGQIPDAAIPKIAARIAAFHADADTSADITELGGIGAVRKNIEENFTQIEKFIGASLSKQIFRDLKAYSDAFLSVKEDAFSSRATQGRIRDCHGDLRAAHFFLEDGREGLKSKISIIDRIEFNRRFRYSDVANDVAFLAMDLDYLQRPDLSRPFVDGYIRASGDEGIGEFIEFFKTYRACVRGKISSFQMDDENLSEDVRKRLLTEAQDYFRLAHSYLPKLHGPGLMMFCGLTGSGKSTLAEEIASSWDLKRVSSDITRKLLAGVDLHLRNEEQYGTGIYAADRTRLTYKAMMEEADKALAEEQMVILDGTFRHSEERSAAERLAEIRGASFWTVEVVVDNPVAKKRITRRRAGGGSVSDGNWEVYQHQKADWEPIKHQFQSRSIALDNNGTTDQTLHALLQWIYANLLTTLQVKC